MDKIVWQYGWICLLLHKLHQRNEILQTLWYYASICRTLGDIRWTRTEDWQQISPQITPPLCWRCLPVVPGEYVTMTTVPSHSWQAQSMLARTEAVYSVALCFSYSNKFYCRVRLCLFNNRNKLLCFLMVIFLVDLYIFVLCIWRLHLRKNIFLKGSLRDCYSTLEFIICHPRQHLHTLYIH